MILALDPSFSGFGLAVVNDSNEIIFTTKLSTTVKDFRKNITGIQSASFDIMKQFSDVLSELSANHGVSWFDYTIVEYPAYQTRSGAELMCLNGMLAMYLQYSKFGQVYWLSPTACNAYIGNKLRQKSYIVSWVKEKYEIPAKKRISHDECTCLVFVKIMQEIINGTYHKSYFKSSDEYSSTVEDWIP